MTIARDLSKILDANGDLNIDANTLFVDSSTNRVGIGTSSPLRVLDIATTTGGTIIHMTDDATGHLATDGVDIQQEGTLLQILNREAGDIRLGTNNTERMRINSSGNVLVGTTDDIPWNNNAGSSADAGIAFRTEGKIAAAGYNTEIMILNRTGTDGTIAQFRKDGTTVGSIGSKGGTDLIVGSGDTGLRFRDADNAIWGFNTSTNADRDNAIALGASGARFSNLYLGGSVYLGGTGSANALDDYEEGTYTPTLTGSTGGSINANIGKYTKVGNLVHVNIGIYNPGTNSNSGQWKFSLPFTVANPSVTGGFTMVQTGVVLELRGVAASGDYLIFTATGNNSYGIIREIYNSAITEGTVLDTSVPTDLLMNIDFTYFTD